MVRTVLFDLDGTLADTAPDLANALNAVLVASGREPLPFKAIRPVVSHGGMALIRLGFGLEPEDPGFEPLRRQLLDHYAAHIADETRLFPGMENVLDQLEGTGHNWGVVTNKPGWLTKPLLDKLELLPRAACVVSGDTLTQRKPDPEPIRHACRLAGSREAECVYVGDAERDILAGREAGMPTLVARFGYIGPDDHPEHWGADGLLDHPEELLTWLDRL